MGRKKKVVIEIEQIADSTTTSSSEEVDDRTREFPLFSSSAVLAVSAP